MINGLHLYCTFLGYTQTTEHKSVFIHLHSCTGEIYFAKTHLLIRNGNQLHQYAVCEKLQYVTVQLQASVFSSLL